MMVLFVPNVLVMPRSSKRRWPYRRQRYVLALTPYLGQVTDTEGQ